MQHNENSRQKTLILLVQELSRAMWLDDTPQILANLVKLANCALESGYVGERVLINRFDIVAFDVAIKSVVDSAMLSAAGSTEYYAVLYGLCTQLTHQLLTANNDSVQTSEHEHDVHIDGSIDPQKNQQELQA